MGSWNFKNVGVSTKKENEKYIEQIMNCLNIKIDNMIYGSEAEVINYDFNPDIIGHAEDMSIDTLELFILLNKLFKDTYVYYEYELGNNTSDYYYREEEIYDPIKKKLFYGVKEYCYGDEIVFGESVYSILREEIEEQARKKGIKISWEEDEYNFEPNWDNEEFVELCEDVIANHSLEELGTKKEIKDIGMIELRETIIEELLENSTKNNYTELISIIEEKIQK